MSLNLKNTACKITGLNPVSTTEKENQPVVNLHIYGELHWSLKNEPALHPLNKSQLVTVYCWIFFPNILFRIFDSVFMRDVYL